MQGSTIITDIAFTKVCIPLKEPFIISLGPLYNAESVFVKIETNGGFIGWGECSPFMSINGESADTAMVVAAYFKKAILGKNALDIHENIALMDSIIFANNSIKSAFDMALYNIAAQHAGKTLYQYLGGAKNKVIETDYTVSVGDADKMATDALKVKEAGFPVIKVKLGKTGQKDVERISKIRATVGMGIPIRIDANQGWSVQEAIQTLRALEPFNIQHCEEPVNRRMQMDLPAIRQSTNIKLMADESCCDIHDAKLLIKTGGCDLFNIKLGKCGGIHKALEIIKLAEENNIKVQIGAFLESRLAMTAFANLALCSENIVYYDFDTALMFSHDPISGGIVYKDNGVIDIPEDQSNFPVPEYI